MGMTFSAMRLSDVPLNRLCNNVIYTPPYRLGYPVYANWSVTVEKLFNPLVVHAIEVTQAIQDWDHSVPLVENKDTYVRAFITTRPEKPAIHIPVKAQLRGYRVLENRRVIELKDSPLPPDNRWGIPSSWSESFRGEISKSRAKLENSTNFRLPPHWTRGTGAN